MSPPVATRLIYTPIRKAEGTTVYTAKILTKFY